jgi:hypothetical protein
MSARSATGCRPSGTAGDRAHHIDGCARGRILRPASYLDVTTSGQRRSGCSETSILLFLEKYFLIGHQKWLVEENLFCKSEL